MSGASSLWTPQHQALIAEFGQEAVDAWKAEHANVAGELMVQRDAELHGLRGAFETTLAEEQAAVAEAESLFASGSLSSGSWPCYRSSRSTPRGPPQLVHGAADPLLVDPAPRPRACGGAKANTAAGQETAGGAADPAATSAARP